VQNKRGRWICAAHVPHGDELSVYEKQDIYIKDTDRVATKRQGLPFDAFGASLESLNGKPLREEFLLGLLG
jgi:hypothetical protein